MKVFLMHLDKMQPSQLYINSSKLESVLKWFNPENMESYEPIPVKRLKDKVIYTDGHTRALVAYMKGVRKIKVCWDEDDLDWEAYNICVNWCIKEGILTIKDLQNKVINDEEYKILWINRCKEMHNRLEKRKQQKLIKTVEKRLRIPREKPKNK